MLMAAQAALPPEVYWERMLPNTPIPKVIREFPKLGSKEIQVQKDISGDKYELQGVKKILPEENQLFVWSWVPKKYELQDGVKKISSEENQLFVWSWAPKKYELQDGDKKISPEELQDGVKKILPEENQLFVWSWAPKKYELQDGVKKISPEENQLFVWSWAPKKYELQDGDKKISPEELQDGVKKISLEENQLFVWSWAPKKYELQDGVKKISPEENQLFVWSWAPKKYELQDGVKKISPEENQLFVWSWAPKKYELQDGDKKISPEELQDGVKKISPEENQLFVWSWAPKKYELQDGVKRILSEELQDGVKKISPEENQLFVWSWAPSKYDVKKNQLEDDGKEIPVANHHHDHSKSTIFFFEEGLKRGAKLDTYFRKMKYLAPLLSREITEHIPFSSKKINEILEILALKPESWNAKNVEKTLEICEEPAMKGEEKYCATSVESMVDFVTSKLGKNVHVTSTEVEIESKSQKFIVKDGVTMLAEEQIIACHPMNYPYVVFYCHKLSNSTAHFVPLEGEDGTRVKSVAVCHRDTSEWDPNHIAMQVLKLKPGTSPVCHFFSDGHLLWYAK